MPRQKVWLYEKFDYTKSLAAVKFGYAKSFAFSKILKVNFGRGSYFYEPLLFLFTGFSQLLLIRYDIIKNKKYFCIGAKFATVVFNWLRLTYSSCFNGGTKVAPAV